MVWGGVACGVFAAFSNPWSLLVLMCVLPAIAPLKMVRSGAVGRELIAVLGLTGRVQMVFGLSTLIAFLVGR